MSVDHKFSGKLEILDSVTDTIGRTPLVNLSRFAADLDGQIFAKLEYFSPGGSKKDRIAFQIIEDAERDGLLSPGQTVIELTSGSTGTGAAIVCAIKGYPFVAVMSAGNSSERARMMQAFGAEVVIVSQSPGAPAGQVSGDDLDLVEERTQALTDELGAFRIDQFSRKGNSEAHEFGTGPEIWEASGGAVTSFCDFAGSGGTFAGLWRAFKARSPEIRGYLIEPEGAAVVSGKPASAPNHRIQGGGYSIPHLSLLEGIEPDGFLTVSDAEAIECARSLAKLEGIFAGYSAGANLAAARKLLQGAERGGCVAIVICDTGLKYMSTDLWA